MTQIPLAANTSSPPFQMSKGQIIATSALVVNIFQMLLCPLLSKMTQVLQVNPQTFSRLHTELPAITIFYQSNVLWLALIAPIIFIIIAIILLRLQIHESYKLVAAGVMALYFLWVFVIIFGATAYPLLQLQSAVPSNH